MPIEDFNGKKDDILVVRTGSGVGKIIRGVEGAFHNNFFKDCCLGNQSMKLITIF